MPTVKRLPLRSTLNPRLFDSDGQRGHEKAPPAPQSRRGGDEDAQ
jgi:hypothetical protein